MPIPHVASQVRFTFCHVGAVVALKRFSLPYTVYLPQVLRHAVLLCERLQTDFAREAHDVTDGVHSSHVSVHEMNVGKLPAANVTRVLGVRMLWS